jgi:membrane protein
LTLYLSSVPTYSAVYGAFATVPILLIWIYTAWVIVLLGAALTAYVPSLIAGIPRRRVGQGWQFQLALEVLQELAVVRPQHAKGLTVSQLCATLQTDALSLEPVLETLTALDWVGQLRESEDSDLGARLILLIDTEKTSLTPLMAALLLPHTTITEKLWQNGQWPSISLRDAL